MLQGCKKNLTDNSATIEQNEFNAVFKNLRNPDFIVSDLILGIQVFKQWDEDNKAPLQVITENMEVSISKTLFEHPTGQISEANITTLSSVLAE